MAQFMDVVSLTKGIRSLFYIVTPNESSFENVEDVPPYVQQATPFFMGLMVVELVVSLLKDGTPFACVSDVVTSVSAGIISRMPTGGLRLLLGPSLCSRYGHQSGLAPDLGQIHTLCQILEGRLI
uniref:Uncharacterized protein n=1 Tax=Hucho hucho TaxID=62062 RepID=A0A4W5N8P6_9TELE